MSDDPIRPIRASLDAHLGAICALIRCDEIVDERITQLAARVADLEAQAARVAALERRLADTEETLGQARRRIARLNLRCQA